MFMISTTELAFSLFCLCVLTSDVCNFLYNIFLMTSYSTAGLHRHKFFAVSLVFTDPDLTILHHQLIYQFAAPTSVSSERFTSQAPSPENYVLKLLALSDQHPQTRRYIIYFPERLRRPNDSHLCSSNKGFSV